MADNTGRDNWSEEHCGRFYEHVHGPKVAPPVEKAARHALDHPGRRIIAFEAPVALGDRELRRVYDEQTAALAIRREITGEDVRLHSVTEGELRVFYLVAHPAEV